MGGVGDLLIVRPRHQSLDELVVDDLFRGAGSVIPQLVGIDVDLYQLGELVPGVLLPMLAGWG